MERLREGGFLISKIHQLSGRIFTKLLKFYKINEINPAQGRVMYPLWRKDNLSFHTLLTRTSLSKASLSHTLENLEKAGYIKRVPSQDDKRTIFIKLTKKSKALHDEFIDVSIEMGNLFYNRFSERERDEVEDYLRRILKNLSKYKEEKKL